MRKKGSLHHRWKENAGYLAIHSWLARNYGKANHCEKCDGLNAKRFDWANLSGEYKRDVNDFIQLCPSCHKKMDVSSRPYCINNHLKTDDNKYIRKDTGSHSCKDCRKEAIIRFRSKLKKTCQ